MKYSAFSFVLILSFLFLSQPVDAQIWKVIKNKTKQKVEDKVAEKVSDKLAEVILEKLSKSFNSSSNPYNGAGRISKPENLPAEYTFDWSYKVKMKNNEDSSDDIIFEYKLPKSGNYFGYSMNDTDQMFSVVDIDNDAIISYMDEEGSSFAISHAYPSHFTNEIDSLDNNSEERFTVTELDSKEFLGYTAKGYEIETSESIMIVYVTSEAGISFSGASALPSLGQFITNNINIKETEDSLTLYMKFTSKSDSDQVFEMECIDLRKESFNKDNSTYKFM